MTEQLTKRIIECINHTTSKSHEEDFRQPKKPKYDTNDTATEPNLKQSEDRNNSGQVKVKVTTSEFTDNIKPSQPASVPYRIVVNEHHRNRNFQDEAQQATNILKNIVMEKMNEKATEESSAFHRVQPSYYQPMPMAFNAAYPRAVLPVANVPVQNSFYQQAPRPMFATIAVPTPVGTSKSDGVTVPATRFLAQPITNIPTGATKIVTHPSRMVSHMPNGMIVQQTSKSTSMGAAPHVSGVMTPSTGTMPSTNVPVYVLQNNTSDKVISPAKKASTQVMPGTSLIYRTPGATIKNRHGKIKRPMNAFMVWARNYRSRLSEEMPQASNAQISVRLGQIWADMALSDKEKYFKEAERIKMQHNRDYPGWVYQPKQRKSNNDTQHDRLWARFGSNVPNGNEQASEGTVTHLAPQISSPKKTTGPIPVTVYPKTPVVTSQQISMTSPLPSFSQLTQTVSGRTPIISAIEADRKQTTGIVTAVDCLGKQQTLTITPLSPLKTGSVEVGQGASGRSPQIVKNGHVNNGGQTSAQTSSLGTSAPTSTSRLAASTGSPRIVSTTSLANGVTVTALPSPKGRPPSISRRVAIPPVMPVLTRNPPRQIVTAKICTDSNIPKTKATNNVSVGVTGPSKQGDPAEDLWPFPLPTVEQTGHQGGLYDDHLRYERETGPEYMDPYNPFYYDGSYDDSSKSGLQIDVNSWQKYLNYTKMQNEADDRGNLSTCFPPSSDGGVWCGHQDSNDVETTHQRYSGSESHQSGSDSNHSGSSSNKVVSDCHQEPRNTSSESFFASSLTSAIHVLEDGGSINPDGYAQVSNQHFQHNRAPQIVDLNRQSNAFHALSLRSGSIPQTSVSSVVYLGQETKHVGSGDMAYSEAKPGDPEGSPPGQSEDSRPLKKRTERYQRDFPNGIAYVTSGDVPTGTYLEDVVFLASPENTKSVEDELSSRDLSPGEKDINGVTIRGSVRPNPSPKLVIDVGHDFVKSLRTGTVITDLTPSNLTNASSLDITDLPPSVKSAFDKSYITASKSKQSADDISQISIDDLNNVSASEHSDASSFRIELADD